MTLKVARGMPLPVEEPAVPDRRLPLGSNTGQTVERPKEEEVDGGCSGGGAVRPYIGSIPVVRPG